MMRQRPGQAGLMLLIGGSLMLAACGGRHTTSAPANASVSASTSASTVPEVLNWRSVATKADRLRLRNWREAWATGLERARQKDAQKLAAQGALFDADRSLPAAVPPPGKYRCRVFKLGAQGTAMAEFTSAPDTDCSVDQHGGVSRFYKNNGPQRAVGTIFDGNNGRAIFLGTLQLGDEGRAMDYGRDTARDLAGYVDRIGDRRWRIILPYPRFESVVDVIELTPAS